MTLTEVKEGRKVRMLLRTEVGSHMWRMSRPDSDHDYFEVYLGSTRHILLGALGCCSNHLRMSIWPDRAGGRIGCQ